MVWWFSMAWKRKDTVEDINVKQGSDADTMLLCWNSIHKKRRKRAAPCRRQNVIYGVKQPRHRVWGQRKHENPAHCSLLKVSFKAPTQLCCYLSRKDIISKWASDCLFSRGYKIGFIEMRTELRANDLCQNIQTFWLILSFICSSPRL